MLASEKICLGKRDGDTSSDLEIARRARWHPGCVWVGTTMLVTMRTIPCPPPVHEPSAERSAIAAFLRGTATGWSKRDLATWLMHHYSPCLASDAAVHPDGRLIAATRAGSGGRVNDESLELTILGARSAALRLLADLGSPLASALTKDARVNGFVVGQRDRLGSVRWAPIGRSRMRLADRVSSLLVADYMNAPSDYATATFCRSCSEIGLGGPVEHAEGCPHGVLAMAA